jgi:hypothetical protein
MVTAKIMGLSHVLIKSTGTDDDVASFNSNIRQPWCDHIFIAAPYNHHLEQTYTDFQDKISFLRCEVIDADVMRMNMDYLVFPQVFQIASGNRPAEHITPGSAKKARSSVVCKYHYLKVCLVFTCDLSVLLSYRRGAAHEKAVGMNTRIKRMFA